ncbi:XdhC family protein [Streptomyces sp. GMY02]|nr:XdhC family protein [Streptomyces sp. GMY02]
MGTERVAARMLELSAGRVPYVHATVVRAQVPSSAHAGDEAIVMPDGSIDGFVGGVCAENSVRTAALGALNGGGPVLLRVLPEGGAGFPESPGARVVVNPCLSGGALEIFLDPKLPPPLIEIVGRTPVADGVAALAEVLGYETARSLPGGLSDHVDAVIVAGHGRDEPASLRAALDAEVPYIALVASRRRGRAVLDDLCLSPEDRARISTPAGLDIGARTGPEVALSILAEVIESVRRGTRRAPRLPDAGAEAGTGAGGLRAAGSPRTVVDPVCGMAVVVMDDTPRLTVDGDDFWFCGDLCRERYARKGAG